MPQNCLLAINMFTDIDGYKALMCQDEQKALELYRKNWKYANQS